MFRAFAVLGMARRTCPSAPTSVIASPILRRTFMSTQDVVGRRRGDGDRTAAVAPRSSGPVSTETKAAFKTTELAAYVLGVIGVLIAAAVVDNADAGGLGAKQAWLYVTILTAGYMISRGLAKSGSREPHEDR
jgi:hypothetical protein